MANNNKNTKKKTIVAKKKLDDSVELQIQKSPAETVSGKIFIALIIIGTLLVPLAYGIYCLIVAMLK